MEGYRYMDVDYGKHQYLRRETSCPLHSHVIDRIIARGLKQEIRNEIANKPFLRMVNFESETFCPDVDVTKAHVAFGRWAIPKLKRELLSQDKITAKRALNSLLDMVHDPEQAVEAVKLKVIPRLVRLLSSDDGFTCQHALMVLEVLALQPGGKMEIVNHSTIMSKLSILMSDSDENVRLSAVKTVKALATWYFGVEELIKDFYVYLIINRLEDELDSNITTALMQTLILLLDQSDEAKRQTLENRGIELSVFLDHPDTKLRALGTEIINQLARLSAGRKAIFTHKSDILSKLTKLLDDEDVSVQYFAAGALMFLLIETPIKNKCLQQLPTICILIRCAQYYRSTALQVNAIKGLTCLAEHPQGKAFLERKIRQIEEIRVETPELQNHKDILLEVIRAVI